VLLISATSPPPGFLGHDEFEISYCVDLSGNCYLVKVDVEVKDFEVSMECPCINHCVWSGDGNNDGEVDMQDLLVLGWHIGDMGVPRNYPDNSAWIGQLAEDWDTWQPNTQNNAKYVDSDGNGAVTENDIQSISEYYLNRHTLIPQELNLKAPYQFDIVPITESVDSGDVAIFEISIGTEDAPVNDIHGLSFSFNLPVNLVDSSSLTMDFHDNCWLSQNAPSLELQVQPWDGRLDVGFSRANSKPVTGQGPVSTLSFIVEEDVEGFKVSDGKIPIVVNISNGFAFDGSGKKLEIPDAQTVIYLDIAREEEPVSSDLHIWPNPTQDVLQVHLNGKMPIQAIEVFNLSGQLVKVEKSVNDKHYQLSLNQLNQGMYIIRVITETGAFGKKFEIIR
jgi:hypothetical protein